MGRAGGASGGSTFHLLSSDRTKTHLDPSFLEELEGRSPGQAKNRFGAYRMEGEAESRVRVGVREGKDELRCHEQSSGLAVRRGKFCAKWTLGHVTGAELLSHSAEPSKSHLVHLLLPQSNPS